jgi:hypothetical protein
MLCLCDRGVDRPMRAQRASADRSWDIAAGPGSRLGSADDNRASLEIDLYPSERSDLALTHPCLQCRHDRCVETARTAPETGG